MEVSVHRPAARQRLDEMCDKLNAGMPVITVTRKKADGTEEVYERRTKKVSDGAQSTAKALIQMYSSFLNRHLKVMPEEMYAEELPLLKTNSESLAKYRKNITARTIRNHIRELKEIKFITEYEFHGSKGNYAMRLNEEVVFGRQISRTKAPVFMAPDFSSPSENGTNFPDKPAIETHGNMNTNSTKDVENIQISLKHINGNTDPVSQNQQDRTNGNMGGAAAALRQAQGDRPQARTDSATDRTESGEGVDNWYEVWKKNGQEALPKEGEPGCDYWRWKGEYRAAIRDFWKYARVCLWPNVGIREKDIYPIYDLIANDWFEPLLKLNPGTEVLDLFVWDLKRAVDVAKNYYDKYTERYPALPYSTSEKWLGYFDKRNPRGFRVAVAFRNDNKATQLKQEGDEMARKALRHLRNHLIGRAPRDIQKMTYEGACIFYMNKMKRYSQAQRNDFALKVLAVNRQMAFDKPMGKRESRNSLRREMRNGEG